ncbi:hypothetical protein C2E25_13750 [Geothermobacter hydrogeniphilus]|uniref:Uncharacterized protein n=1 Tax=Geothermobacter hydrogeniphilus TaxID=1969733 RepID=A0A2K2H7B7_9BACT|nr:hypothetical protein [Geothermobacter hydrogeniphilus]PNU19205.1 hypothetical protein C2E25_13750 [Geothermobacter hydrogeniphilus]
MKKIIVISAVLVFLAPSCFAAVSSNATGTLDLANNTGLSLYGDPTTATSSTALIGKTSTGVGVAWNTATGGYALMTQHKSGTKAYGSSYDSTAIYVTTGVADPGTAAYNSGALNGTDTSDFSGTGWKTM